MHNFDELLCGIMKPGRYIGSEWNLPRKDFAQANIKFALCFPDLYEVGMSNLGLRIIYGILNNIEDVACERVFAPAPDLEGALRLKQQPIFSLESGKSLRDFDLLGFTLGHELGFVNILSILDLSSIPFSSSSRSQEYPLIIGGGPCVLNPEPLHEFFDLFIIGEAEEAVVELIDKYRRLKTDYRSGALSKTELLIALSAIEGVYAPQLYEVDYGARGEITRFKPKFAAVKERIKKRVINNFAAAFFPSQWLLPFIQIVHDRISLEIMRGCPNRCRFCQARSQYFPYRIRSVKNILETADQTYKNTGYEEIALTGLSVSDYPNLEELLRLMIEKFKEKCVGLSLPSIKPRSIVGGVSSAIAAIKKMGLTFAPEAGTDKLRRILGKDFEQDNFFLSLQQAYKAGYQHVKLYFMIGLPLEEDADLAAIVDLAFFVSGLRRKLNLPPAGVNISINTLIPKPHTPFQWFKMQELAQTQRKYNYIRDKVGTNKKIKVNFHHPGMSFIEGVFSRGDRRLSGVLIKAFELGCRLDAWGEYFNFEKWQAAFLESGIDPNSYLQEKPRDERLPWDFLDVGIEKEALLSEFNKIIAI